MKSHTAIKIDQIAVDVVENLDLGSGFRQENGKAPGKGFNITGVLCEKRKDLRQEAGFSAGPNNCGFYCWIRGGCIGRRGARGEWLSG